MAKRVRAVQARHFAPAALLSLLLAPNALAEWKFVPGVTVRETYTDNVALEDSANARGRFVTEVAPSFSVSNNGPRLRLRSSYQYHYYAYDDDDVPGARHSASSLNADMQAHVIDELFFIDANASISQQPVSAFGRQAGNSTYANANLSDVKVWRVSPYLRHTFGSFASGEARYTRDSVDAGGFGMRHSTADTVLLALNSGPQFRKVDWNIRATQERLHYDDGGLIPGTLPNATSRQASLGLGYRLLSSLRLTATVGYDEYDYESLGDETKGRFYNAGFQWTPSARTSVIANAGKRYYGDSYQFQALHRSRRSVWNISYNESVTTSRSQFLLPATIDTAVTLDRLFTPQIPDPAQRALAVAAYIRANNLPASLADSINYFTNRFILQKQFQASVAFNTARSTMVLNAFSGRRQALSSVRADSTISGPFSANINDNTRQRGGSALYNYRLSGRSSVIASYTNSRSESETTGLESDFSALRLALQRQFSPRTRADVELRRMSGNAAGQRASYRENAISASLSMTY